MTATTHAATCASLPREGRGMEIFPGISMDPEIRFGKPCIAGTRIDVAMVLAQLAAGASAEELWSDYQLSREQITAALRCADHIE